MPYSWSDRWYCCSILVKLVVLMQTVRQDKWSFAFLQHIQTAASLIKSYAKIKCISICCLDFPSNQIWELWQVLFYSRQLKYLHPLYTTAHRNRPEYFWGIFAHILRKWLGETFGKLEYFVHVGTSQWGEQEQSVLLCPHFLISGQMPSRDVPRQFLLKLSWATCIQQWMICLRNCGTREQAISQYKPCVGRVFIQILLIQRHRIRQSFLICSGLLWKFEIS